MTKRTSFLKIEPSKWPYNPKRYFKRNGVETADNFRAVKGIYKSIPEAKRNYKNLPRKHKKAIYNFSKEYKGWSEKEVSEDIKRKHLNACIIQVASIIAFIFMPFSMFYNNAVLPNFYENGKLLFSFSNNLVAFPVIGMTIIFGLCFLVTNYKAFTCRNRITMSPIGYLKVLLKYPSQISPVQFVDDTMEEKDAEWSQRIFKG